MINIITEKRADAIGIYNKALISNLIKIDANVNEISLNNKFFKSFILNFLLELINSIKILFRINRDDVILFTDPFSLNFLCSIFISNKKYLIFHHCDREPYYYKFIPFLSLKKVLGKIDGFICSSSFSLEQLETLEVNPKKCKIIHCGLNRDLFKPTMHKLYNFNYVLSVGTEEPRKNMKNIIASFQLLAKKYPELKLLKIGKANIENRQKTLSYVEENRLGDKIIFTDFIEENKLPQIYSGAKLLLFPSLLEGFGLPIVEAMACGCPVVTSNRNPMEELVGLKQSTADPNDPSAIATACEKILSDPDHRATIVKNGLNRAKDFNWEKTANEVYNFISKNNLS